MARSGWAAIAVALALVAAGGNELAADQVADAGDDLQPLLESLTMFPAWNADALGLGSDIYVAIGAKVLVLLVGLFVFAAASGRSSSAGTAFLAGWGSFLVSCGIAAATYTVVGDLTADGLPRPAPYVQDMNAAAAFALYTGPLVGAAVAIGRRRAAVIAPPLLAGEGAEEPPPAPPIPPAPVATWPPQPLPVLPKRQPDRPPPITAPPQSPPPITAPPQSPPTGTTAPSPSWSPSSSPLPASPLPRRRASRLGERFGGETQPSVAWRPTEPKRTNRVPASPDPAESLDAAEAADAADAVDASEADEVDNPRQ